MQRVIFPLLVLLLGSAGAAAADPVTLTSGTITVDGPASADFGFGSFDFSGSGFNARGSGFGGPTIAAFTVGTLNLSGGIGVSPTTSQDNGSVTVGGQTLHGFTSASFQVTADPFVVPDSTQGTFSVFQTPFSAQGVVQLFARPLGNSIFTQDVTGTGMMSISGHNIGGGEYRTDFVRLTFSPAASPTPEPASMLLLGTGLVAAWRFRRLRRAE